MLRIHTIENAAAAKKYYTVGDYFLETPGQWLGKGAERLGLVGNAKREDFEKLCDNINPVTGKGLTVKTIDNRRVGWDFNFNATKSVGIVLELAGDEQVQQAHREAVKFAMGYVEADMRTRVRKGGKDEDRVTGNLVAMRVTHRTTRPNKDDEKPDMSLHDHVVVFNSTFDEVENKWKAAQIGQLKHDANYYEAIYHNRLAGNLRSLGYGVRRNKTNAFEISGVSEELMRKFSRRTADIEAEAERLEKKHGVKMGLEAKSKLGATTRLNKVGVVAADLKDYWTAKLTAAETDALSNLKGQPSFAPGNSAEYAIDHLFERQAVVDEKRVYTDALRHGIGFVTPECVAEEAKRRGLIVKHGESTTKAVLKQEGRLIDFARDGRGTMRPLRSDSNDKPNGYAGLSAEQQALCRHVWESPDRILMIEGDAGVGKSTAMVPAVAGIDSPVVMLAPSSEASRNSLRKDFPEADTVASFLIKPEFQERARGGVIWIDEAGQLSMNDLEGVFNIAKAVDARVILQGDRKQHGSVARGEVLEALERFAGLPVARLKEIRRQTHKEYRQAVKAIAKGDVLAGYDAIDGLGWVKNVDSNKPLVDDYLATVEAGKSVLVVSPTHVQCDDITADIRERLKEKGKLGKDEKVFEILKPLNWTEAQRRDNNSYDGSEIVKFHRSRAPYRAGDCFEVGKKLHDKVSDLGKHFGVFTRDHIRLAEGDRIRITANAFDITGKHRLNNGSLYVVRQFTKKGIELNNGWFIPNNFQFMTGGYCSTSHAAQGKTVDRVLIATGSDAAVNSKQFYVSVSRGREGVAIYNTIGEDLRDAIQRSATRKTATELVGRRHKHRKIEVIGKRLKAAYRQLREMGQDMFSQRKQTYAR